MRENNINPDDFNQFELEWYTYLYFNWGAGNGKKYLLEEGKNGVYKYQGQDLDTGNVGDRTESE